MWQWQSDEIQTTQTHSDRVQWILQYRATRARRSQLCAMRCYFVTGKRFILSRSHWVCCRSRRFVSFVFCWCETAEITCESENVKSNMGANGEIAKKKQMTGAPTVYIQLDRGI